MSGLSLEALFEDVDYAKETDLPLQFDFRFNVAGDEVYGNVFTPSPSFGGNRPVVMFFHGFTGFVRMDDVLMALLRAGCVVASVHHRGAWGSKGRYSVTNCIEDAVALAEWAQSDEFCQKYGADPDSVFLMGHSLGCNTVLNALPDAQGVRGAILLTPCDISALTLAMTEDQRVGMYAGNGIEVLTFDGVPALIENVLDNADWMSFQSVAERIPSRPMLIASAKWDPICPASAMIDPLLQKLGEIGYNAPIVRKDYPARHSLMGVRVDISKDVAAFIEEVLGE